MPGDATFNRASIDINDDATFDSEAETCQDLPFLTMQKTLSTISSQNPNGSYDVTYQIIVQNIGGLSDDYDLFDHPQFEDDITINRITVTSPVITTITVLSPAPGSLQIANNVIIAAGATQTYTVVANVYIDLLDGVTGDDMYDACGSALGGGTPSAGEGLFNEALLDASGDGIPEVIDTACGDLPFLVLAKMLDSTVVTGLNCYDVYYTITVENIGGAAGTYDLIDDPMFDTDFMITSATYSTDAAGYFGNDLPLSGTTQYTLATAQSIVSGKVDAYKLKIGVCIDLETAASVGNEIYDASCGTAAGGGDSSTGEGLHNEALLDTNNDGNED